MSPELQAMRQRFMEQAPGLAIFDELAAKYDRLLMDLSHLDRRWKTALPDQVRALRVALQEIADTAQEEAIKLKAEEALEGKP